MEREIIAYLQLINVYLLWKLYKRRNERSKRWRARRWWVRPINERRSQQGDFRHLFQELKEDPQLFFRYTRMTVELFYKLLDNISARLQKSHWRALTPEHRLAITLRYLATGDQTLSVALAYRVGESTVAAVVKETCTVLIDVLVPDYLKTPTKNDWERIRAGYLQHWNLPNCIGSIDGKHIVIQAPPNSGSLFYNYKKNFSIVLMAACDSQYKFTLLDIGAYGSENDAGVFSRSSFGQALFDNRLNIPPESVKLPGSEIATSLFFVGDDAFPLKNNIMKPHSGRNLERRKSIFNYRLSRARRTIENAFGILSSRWRIFRRPICLHPKNVDKIVMAAVCLHNFLMVENNKQDVNERTYCPTNFIDREDDGQIRYGTWRDGEAVNGLQNIRKSTAHRAFRNAYDQRDALSDYFLTPSGEVPWQYDYVRRGEKKGEKKIGIN